MQQFAALLSPSANRVYARTAAEMMTAELGVFAEHLLEGSVGGVERTELGGIPYLVFETEDLTGRDLERLANLSSLYALFKVHGTMLEPVALSRLDRYDDDLLSILKYTGKTNEQFTKLLLNVTAAVGSAERFLSGPLRILDPMCGRGTTLNQAAMYGWDAHGIEIDKKDFDAYEAFVKRWLKTKRLKHQAHTNRVKREGSALGKRLLIEFAATKDLYKAGELQTMEMVNADTRRAGDVYRKQFFDLIVTDAPYGVKHAAVGSERIVHRSPKPVLEAAIPVWVDLLRGGGALGLSWNTQVLPQAELEAILTGAGLEPMDSEPFGRFAHRVDQAIDRDLIVARKPS